MVNEAEKVKLRKSFSEIISRYSIYQLGNQTVFVKHRGPTDELITDFHYGIQYQKLVKSGIFTEKEKLDYLIKNNLWTAEKEEQIKYSKSTISDLYNNKRKVFKFADIKNYSDQIEENQNFLIKILNDRADLIGETAESGSRKFSDLLVIQRSFFKDAQLQNLLYDEESFEDLDMNETDDLFELYRRFQNDLNDEVIRRIAIQDFFRELFGLTEDIYNFFAVPLVNLTALQSKLLLYGRYLNNLLQNNQIPQDILDSGDAGAIEDFANGRANLAKIIEKADNESDGVLSIPGAKEEISRYGFADPIQDSKQSNVKEIQKAAEGNSGELSIEDSKRFGFI